MAAVDAACVASGAAVGAVLRWRLSSSARFPSPPWATCSINVTGSLFLGSLAAFGAGGRLSPRARLLLGTGLAGGFTTFSTFALDTVQLAEAGRWGAAAAYVAASNVGAVGGAGLAYKLAKRR